MNWLKLFSLWCEAGFDPAQFWVQTPRLLKAALDGYSQRIRWEHRERMNAAWHGAVIGRISKVPPLDRLLGERSGQEAQTPEQMIAAMQILAATKR
ncbi:hypothetical protein BV98_001443 [Sphingobium herbicidovorans NBRC 16415]|uniref:Phage tail assembly chaperone n=1 Tax=Sphingobium herbicidovorans (strain ATCC 700291 / DSM 11019 / CCUG 56400 / KCTC 2939 / LMG 18315 / NBRC 16415 / MH) TaxID=1219045 RepID=A0A086PBG3_SPHHM|nr:hypothetical protein [Sphingobium herbicidovorans]KFG90731.1 hypothetical protein BV98_001443 [Sphingobium herbicidovorans NBRC 16415]